MLNKLFLKKNQFLMDEKSLLAQYLSAINTTSWVWIFLGQAYMTIVPEAAKPPA